MGRPGAARTRQEGQPQRERRDPGGAGGQGGERGRTAEERKRSRAEDREEAKRRRAEERASKKAEQERAVRAAFLGMDDVSGAAAIDRAAAEAGVGVAAAKRIRAELARAGEVTVRRGGPQGPRSGYAPALTAALKADPARLDGAIAEEVGCNHQAVRRFRKKLGIKSSREIREESATGATVDLVAELGRASAQQVADETGLAFGTAKRRLDALADAGSLRRLDVQNPGKGDPRTVYAVPASSPRCTRQRVQHPPRRGRRTQDRGMPHELRRDEIERRERALREPEESALSGAFRERLGNAALSRRQATHRMDQPGPEADEVGLVGTALRDAMGDGAAAVEKAGFHREVEEPIEKAIGDRLRAADLSGLLKGRRVIARRETGDTPRRHDRRRASRSPSAPTRTPM